MELNPYWSIWSVSQDILMKQARGKKYLSLEASHMMSYNLTLCTKQSAKKFFLGI